MIPSDIATAARDLYNASGDSYFSDTQMYNWIWQASHDLAKKAWLIERTYTTTSVANQQSYTYPTTTIAIKRVTVNGRKIKRITHREDDAITLSNATVTATGWPIYYTDFDYTLYLRPIPDGTYTIQIYTYNDATYPITASSTLEIPALFHFDMVDYVLFRMFGKDKNPELMQFHLALWQQHVKDAIAYKNRMKRTDSFATVQSEENLPVTILGEA